MRAERELEKLGARTPEDLVFQCDHIPALIQDDRFRRRLGRGWTAGKLLHSGKVEGRFAVNAVLDAAIAAGRTGGDLDAQFLLAVADKIKTLDRTAAHAGESRTRAKGEWGLRDHLYLHLNRVLSRD